MDQTVGDPSPPRAEDGYCLARRELNVSRYRDSGAVKQGDSDNGKFDKAGDMPSFMSLVETVLCATDLRRRLLAEIDCNLVFVRFVRLVPCLFFFDVVFTGEKFSLFVPC